MSKDYFMFDTIRDKTSTIVCYYVTMIGTLEPEGKITVRTDLSEDGKAMAFGKLTVRAQDHKVSSLLRETGSRIAARNTLLDDTQEDLISFTVNEKRLEAVRELEIGDRVLIEGRAYLRKSSRYPDRLPELSVTATGVFLLGHARSVRRVSQNKGLVPQK